ncbi:unnamed protein product [Rotaria sp. Silwood2]|nr:unnamed protein product [Rotaria sp. Silwood2]CAF3098286.1 unnamed protein product [Rotaria sp. Silwood2]CAF3412567.1 unnamed protein product [Rotaria sp. Silwood2]CAF4158415.1 unnamed protein product [Rotaria sp. Silwood2]CAF4188756.1 unnamed protein product [Rotaria sp. Silwood2]
MSDNFQAPPPSYAEFQNKYAPAEPIQTYPMPQQGEFAEMKYQTINPPNTVVYGVQVVPLASFNRSPTQCTCPNCRSTIITRTEETTGLLTWLLCILLIVFGCWLGCCLIPFCVSDLQNVKHYCPSCNAFLGEYRPL